MLSLFLCSLLNFGPVLHPKYKLKYFERANWEPEWIDTAEELLRSQFNQSYRKVGVTGMNKSDNTTEPSVCPLLHGMTEMKLKGTGLQDSDVIIQEISKETKYV